MRGGNGGLPLERVYLRSAKRIKISPDSLKAARDTVQEKKRDRFRDRLLNGFCDQFHDRFRN